MELELNEMRREQAQAQSHLAAMEDRRRWKNFKIRGIPEQIDKAEIPQLGDYSHTFSAKQRDASNSQRLHHVPLSIPNSTAE
ncbi:Hypothetical predicted protein [Pelobates cultripes]|uniref:Uncharacterized protein n=1 Tax=Pelobates cultripes TaxID=61616 RepID=A0AAD1TDS8_PELCU|nr:Hypothetical predicted protein [Pelobates cultripes]